MVRHIFPQFLQTIARRLEIDDTITRQYRRFGDTGTQLVVRLRLPSDNSNPVSHCLASLNDLYRQVLQYLNESDMVGIKIQNRENQNDKPIGISFRRKYQLASKVILSLVQKVSQSNARFNALDKLMMTVHSVRMPVAFGKWGIKSSGRPLSVMAHLKKECRGGKIIGKLSGPRDNNTNSKSGKRPGL